MLAKEIFLIKIARKYMKVFINWEKFIIFIPDKVL